MAVLGLCMRGLNFGLSQPLSRFFFTLFESLYNKFNGFWNCRLLNEGNNDMTLWYSTVRSA